MSALDAVARSRLRRRISVVRPWPWAAALLLWLLACAISGGFSVRLLLVSLTLAVFLALAGLGQMVVLASGDGSFDLSLPYTITLAGYLSSGVIPVSPVLRVVIAIALGAIVGVANGILTAALKLPGIIASLAIGYVLFSAILFVQGDSATDVSAGLAGFVHLEADGASAVIVLEVVVGVLLAGLLARMVYGRYLSAMGQNREAAKLAGIPVARMIVLNFVVCGVLGGIVGVLLSAYDNGAFADMGDVYLLGSVGAVVVGGTPVSGGRTSVTGTIAGALVMTVLVSMLELTKASAGAQDLAEGLVVIAVVVTAGVAARLRGAKSAVRPGKGAQTRADK
ncbi:ABC transporter permease [Amycolatopsis sp. NPDC051903]|uniref:ABC transporter permease n=1 Tax=Amycolatopsis sp. NPDC051903 TaxID=3363936 RepID=UPI0037A7F3C8